MTNFARLRRSVAPAARGLGALVMTALLVVACRGPATGSEWTVGILESSGEATGVATLADVRSGRHDGFDRVVWTFEEGLPEWRLEYVDRPVRACGSGAVVPLPGDAWLEVKFEPARAHDDQGRLTAAAPGATPALDRVREVARTCDFEAMVVHVLAVESPEAFRVIELDGPPRVVVDVRHGR